jgi:uncharacterized membrane protein YhiD involved in acid resistance
LTTSGLGAVSHLEFTIRVVLALVFGSVIGLERQWRQRLAGLRTNALVATNTILRPLVSFMNRQLQPGAEVISSYEIRAVCRQEGEERVRTLMIATVRSAAMSLIAVYSEDIEATNRVEVIADVTVAGRPDAKLEKIVTKLGIEPGVFAVSWKIVPTSDEERELLPEA